MFTEMLQKINDAVDELEQVVYAWLEENERLLFWIALITLFVAMCFLLSQPVSDVRSV